MKERKKHLVRYRIRVDVARQELYGLEENKVVITAPCSTGSGIASEYGLGTTPKGCYPITSIVEGREEALLVDPSGRWNPYGPFVAGLGIPGRNIAIHGTDKPEDLGKPVSAGCIRIRNDLILKLINDGIISPGTLVEIVGNKP